MEDKAAPETEKTMFEFLDVKYKDIIDLPELVIEKGKITTLVGPSGSGKTTILRMLNKMISPTQGRILFQGVDLARIASVAHRRQVTMLSQSPAMFEGTVRDNMTAGLRFQDRQPPDDAALTRVLEQVKLPKPLDGEVGTLSGGEKQRLSLGRVLLLDPMVYLLDEPSSALDDETEIAIIEMLTSHARKQNGTIVMVTHSRAIAEKYSDVLLEITAGKCLDGREKA